MNLHGDCLHETQPDQEMPRIFDWAAREVDRILTVADLKGARVAGKRYAQVTANTTEEAEAAELAGVEMVVARAANVSAVRAGSKRLFVTAALGFGLSVTVDEILRAAFLALMDGADAIITARGYSTVEMLASEDIPVMGHLGLVPRKSTWVGGLRAVGKTREEAMELFERFRLLEAAGAFAVECEVIPELVMAEINKRTGLVTVSLGSGPSADVQFLFTEDICGDVSRLPRHARSYGNLSALRSSIVAERVSALSAFRNDISSGAFPARSECARISEAELAKFVEQLQANSA